MVEITYQIVLSTLQTVGLLVGIFYYVTTLRNAQKTRELALKAQQQAGETRQAQLFTQILDKDLQRPNVIAKFNVLDMEFDGYEEFWEKYGKENNPEAYYDWAYMMVYMEGLGVLVREGYFDIRLVALMSSGIVIRFWEKFIPITKEYRRKYNYPRWEIEFEYLYNELMKYIDEHPELKP